jgi:hypothetical protein
MRQPRPPPRAIAVARIRHRRQGRRKTTANAVG